jgi:aspartyl-tRNA(Asn)/glutamyl-tRNA(Gln) amidotransferase subunit A
MKGDEVALTSISELARRIAQRQLSPIELTENILARIESHDGILNSYITVMTESARAAAKRAEEDVRAGRPLGLLHGVPVAVKDLFATQGTLTTFACAAFADWIPAYDAAGVERLLEAGAIIIGKLNLHEAASGSSSLISHSGPVRNPWNPEYIAGGSSGGSGAAVAAGLAYGALGSDTAMSIRHPAACCGIVGLKPTYGRVSKHGALALAWSLDHVGPMTRTVRDAALMLQAIAGHDPRDSASKDLPVPDYIAGLDDGARGLRIGIPRPHFFENCTDATLAAVEQAIDVLRNLGARMEDCELPHAADAPPVSRLILLAEAAAYHAQRFRSQPELLGRDLRVLVEMGSMFTAVQYLQAQRTRHVITKAFNETMQRFDALIMPTAPLPPCKASDDNASLTAPRNRNTLPFNLTGLPAISVPCGFTADGMPIGLQIVGHPFDEAILLRIANAYEQATPWHTRHPEQFL